MLADALAGAAELSIPHVHGLFVAISGKLDGTVAELGFIIHPASRGFSQNLDPATWHAAGIGGLE
ncbi:hypothetical protein [Ensifer aridi]|uniref:hypothetical protein n=1 Tax=Ensifer aridi TaxID=1708715 RepID=UPI00061514F8|nr:hypothetical protein [Ensifer aridi]